MKLTSSCYAIPGLYYLPPWSVNSGFIAGSSKTLIVDSGGTYHSAQTIYGYTSSVKTDNELILINTEQHLDHIGGNCYFHERGILIYGHKNINRSQQELEESIIEINTAVLNEARRNNNEGAIVFQNTVITNPDITIDKDCTIDLGDVKASVILTPGHTKSNLSVYEPGTGVLFCGDCIVTDYIPNLESGDRHDWKEWLNSLSLILSLNPQYIVPGHGRVLAGKESIKSEVERIRKIIIEAIESGTAPTV